MLLPSWTPTRHQQAVACPHLGSLSELPLIRSRFSRHAGTPGTPRTSGKGLNAIWVFLRRANPSYNQECRHTYILMRALQDPMSISDTGSRAPVTSGRLLGQQSPCPMPLLSLLQFASPESVCFKVTLFHELAPASPACSQNQGPPSN